MIQFSNLCLAAGLISAAGVVAEFHDCPSGSPAAKTGNGTVCGVHLPLFSQNTFLGVPFAQPPLKSLRLKHPVSLNSSYDSYAADAQPPSCPGYAGFEVGIGTLSEDCLYLNIVAPDMHYYGAGLPVLVWKLLRFGKPVLGVSINYRVGGWGFLASQEILADGSANIGLYDQRMALQWLRENIAGSGGDPDQITIWGESAGAFSVGYHLIGFDGQHDDMFRAAILESGTMLGSALQDAETMALEDGYQAMYDNVTETVGCATEDSLACLKPILVYKEEG
ncbi:lipase 4 [Penicillium lividum]|nr:lipase 4 [Penicillium lividum]